jgi:SAM-dependent methyltransferase
MTDAVEAFDTGLIDFFRSGWFQGDVMYPGFRIVPEDVVLDAGCGNGGQSAFIGRQGAHVIVSDILPEQVKKVSDMVRTTRARGVTELIAMSERIALPDGHVTKVVCTEVLEHVPDPKLMMSELVRVARPGAKFAISAPDPRGEALQKLVAPDSHFRPPNHIRIFSVEDFAALVRDSGLIIETHDRYGFYSAMMISFFWLVSDKTTLEERDHPLLKSWSETWRHVLDMEGGLAFKKKLDSFLPSTQMIIARKPG